MSDDFITVKIMELLSRHARGRQNAMPRAALERLLMPYGIGKNDRAIRLAYSVLPICACTDGLYVPTKPEDVDEYRRYLAAKLPAAKVDTKIRRIVATWPALAPVAKHEQMTLVEAGA
mgnify:CR=1 FL=1